MGSENRLFGCFIRGHSYKPQSKLSEKTKIHFINEAAAVIRFEFELHTVSICHIEIQQLAV